MASLWIGSLLSSEDLGTMQSLTRQDKEETLATTENSVLLCAG